MSLLGYSPLEYFSGRAPLEAAAQGIELGPNDWAVRCNLVTVTDQTMQSFTAGHISNDEARACSPPLKKNSVATNGNIHTGCQLSESAAVSRSHKRRGSV